MALFDHNEGDIEVKILGFESDWKKRRVKEAIAISKIKPNLNDDDGLKLSAIYESLPSKFALETRSTEMTSLRNRIPKEAVIWERHTVEQSTEEIYLGHTIRCLCQRRSMGGGGGKMSRLPLFTRKQI